MKSIGYMNTSTHRRIPNDITRAEYRKRLRADRKARVKALKLKKRIDSVLLAGKSKLELTATTK